MHSEDEKMDIVKECPFDMSSKLVFNYLLAKEAHARSHSESYREGSQFGERLQAIMDAHTEMANSNHENKGKAGMKLISAVEKFNEHYRKIIESYMKNLEEKDPESFKKLVAYIKSRRQPTHRKEKSDDSRTEI